MEIVGPFGANVREEEAAIGCADGSFGEREVLLDELRHHTGRKHTWDSSGRLRQRRQSANREDCGGAESKWAALSKRDRLLLGCHCILPARATVPPDAARRPRAV